MNTWTAVFNVWHRLLVLVDIARDSSVLNKEMNWVGLITVQLSTI